MRILVLNTFGFHLGYLGCYGNDWIATPNLDRLAAEGIVFDRHFVRVPDIGQAPSTNDWLAPARQRLDNLDAACAIAPIVGPAPAAPRNISHHLFTMDTVEEHA